MRSFKYIIIPDDCKIIELIPPNYRRDDTLDILLSVLLTASRCKNFDTYISLAISWIEALDGDPIDIDKVNQYKKLFRKLIIKWKQMLSNRYIEIPSHYLLDYQYRQKDGSFVFKTWEIQTWSTGKNKSDESSCRKC